MGTADFRTVEDIRHARISGPRMGHGQAHAGPAGAAARGRITPSQDEWTVLTMAPDGAWGVATDHMVNHAIAGAIAKCKAMSRSALGCGAVSTSVQVGWSLGMRCGNENILAADSKLENAERIARAREIELRESCVPDMPPCRRVVTVDPRGWIVAPRPDAQVASPVGNTPQE